MTSWFQQMKEIGLLPPAVDLTPIIEEVEVEPPSRASARGGYSTNVPRPLANDPALVERSPPATTFLDSTLRVFLDDHEVGAPAAAGDLAYDWHENEATYEIATAAGSSSASESMPKARRKRKRTIDSQSPARDAPAPLFAPSARSSKRSRSNGTLVPAYPCARCIEKDIECRICYVGGACNVCRAGGRKCDLVDPETKHINTSSITKTLSKLKRDKNSKGSAG